MIFTLSLAVMSLVISAGVIGYGWYWLRSQREHAQEFSQALLSGSVRHDRLQQSVEKLQQEIGQLRQRLDTTEPDVQSLTQRVDKVEDYAGVCVPPKPAASGFNINRRVEAVRMFHDGYSEEAIAEQLMTPLGEIRLLIHLEKNGKQRSQADSPRRGSRKVPAA